VTATCGVCGKRFSYIDGEPDHCGALGCRARRDWSDEDWAGLARMATARRAAGVPLNELDWLALGE
jgi:hypothetical protein